MYRRPGTFKVSLPTTVPLTSRCFLTLSVVYNFEDYDFYRKDGLTRGSRTLSEEKVKWVSKPPDQIAFQDRAVWYEPEVREAQNSGQLVC